MKMIAMMMAIPGRIICFSMNLEPIEREKVLTYVKTKECHTCKNSDEVMYRIQIKKGKEWVFVCPDCQTRHAKGDFYRYGGTWKGYRH
jgi:hypothetical protein